MNAIEGPAAQALASRLGLDLDNSATRSRYAACFACESRAEKAHLAWVGDALVRVWLRRVFPKLASPEVNCNVVQVCESAVALLALGQLWGVDTAFCEVRHSLTDVSTRDVAETVEALFALLDEQGNRMVLEEGARFLVARFLPVAERDLRLLSLRRQIKELKLEVRDVHVRLRVNFEVPPRHYCVVLIRSEQIASGFGSTREEAECRALEEAVPLLEERAKLLTGVKRVKP